MLVDIEVNDKILFDIYTGNKIDTTAIITLIESHKGFKNLKKTMIEHRTELKLHYGFDDLEKDKRAKKVQMDYMEIITKKLIKVLLTT
jgi:hypothetical protein